MVAPKDKDSLLEELRRQKTELASRYPLHSMALFGSWARGEQTPESDVDILVEVEPTIGLRIVELAEELEKALGKSVDLISHRAIQPNRWKSIQEDLINV